MRHIHFFGTVWRQHGSEDRCGNEQKDHDSGDHGDLVLREEAFDLFHPLRLLSDPWIKYSVKTVRGEVPQDHDSR